MNVTKITMLLLAFAVIAPASEASLTASRAPLARAADPPVYQLASPTGNIQCIAMISSRHDGSMRCWLKRVAKLLPRPEWAQCDWDGGKAFSLGATGAGDRASFCDAFGGIYKRETRLAYGRTWQRGPFTCLSSQLGLLCTNDAGHGLFLSYGQQRFF